MNGRFAIINADDFGQSQGVNRGVAEAHEHGILTSASAMVRWPAAAEAAAYARAHPALGVGLHFDLGEWALREGEWAALYEVADLQSPSAIANELTDQLNRFHDLFRRPPTHIDSHQHKHLREPVRSIVCDAAARLGIAVRELSVPYCGRFYGQDETGATHPDWISVPALIDILTGLATDTTEIACHPAAAEDLDTMYRGERLTELRTLCDPRVREAIALSGIGLISFAAWNSAAKQPPM